MRTPSQSASSASFILQNETTSREAVKSGEHEPAKRSTNSPLVIVEKRSFVRGCIQASLSSSTSFSVVGLSTIDEYLERSADLQSAVLILCAVGADVSAVSEQLTRLHEARCSAPIVVLSDENDIDLMMMVLDSGASGFMPTDISLEVAVHALRLIAAGGQYFPAIRLSARRAYGESEKVVSHPAYKFTRRQAAVIDALRKGKANKIIAYELNMCESTVKVHVRNIMKKLKAKNRTEVAYLANDLFIDPTL
jgi:DNA-binding NarL/FixJ family response regulator